MAAGIQGPDMAGFPSQAGAPLADPYWNAVVLQPSFNGGYVDLTAASGPLVIDQSQYKRPLSFNSGGAFTNAQTLPWADTSMDTASTLDIQWATDPTLVMGNDDFTYELWIYMRSFSTINNFGGQENGTATAGRWFLGSNSPTGNIPAIWFNGSSFVTASVAMKLNQFNHIAYSRKNSATLALTRFHVNGRSLSAFVDGNTYSAAIPFTIRSGSGAISPDGIIQQARLTHGVARYANIPNFTPSRVFPFPTQ